MHATTLVSLAAIAFHGAIAATGAEAVPLRHSFAPGEKLLIETDHHGVVQVTENEETHAFEHKTLARRSYLVQSVDANGWATVISQVESVKMESTNEAGSETYDSENGGPPADQFKEIAQTVGIPLAKFRVSPTGAVEDVKTLLAGVTKVDASSQSHEHPFVRLPEEPIEVGGTWSETYKEVVKPSGDLPVRVSVKRKYTLDAVENGIATISWRTVVLTPVSDSVLESELVQRNLNGSLQFAIASGRIVRREASTKAQVVGFLGGGSMLECDIKRSEVALTKTAAGYARPLR